MKELMLSLVLLLAAYGMADLVERLVWRLLFFKKTRLYCVMPIYKEEEAEFLAFKAAAERNRMSHGGEWILLACGLGEEGERLTKELCNQWQFQYCDKTEFAEMVGLQEGESVV